MQQTTAPLANEVPHFRAANDLLANAVLIAGWPCPTPEALAAALAELGGPSVAEVLAWGWMEPTPDKKGLRYPPIPPAALWARMDCPPAPAAVPPGPPPLFSLYRGPVTNLAPCEAISPARLHHLLTSGRYKAQTEALRAAPPDSSQRAELKKQLDYVTPAGTFTRRANGALKESSGLLVLDFDYLPALPAARAALLADAVVGPAVGLLFVSPSGNGLKAIVETDPAASHLDNFRAYANYLAAHYTDLGLVPDPSGKDVARACFIPHDPAAWLAPAKALSHEN